MKIKEIINLVASDAVKRLIQKQIFVPSWGGEKGLQKSYDPQQHEVANKAKYPDIIREDGTIEKVSRITYSLQRLAVSRMSGLMFGLPTQRVYHSENERQEQIGKYIEKILTKNRIDSLNLERARLLFCGCEVATLWYAVLDEDKSNIYGFKSNVKLKCVNYTPTKGDELYPLFDDNGDLVALSVMYCKQVEEDKYINILDTYTKQLHIRYIKQDSSQWEETLRERIAINKIPLIYIYRPTPIWEDTDALVNELEWTLSRNGNYLRANARPMFGLFTDECLQYGNEGANTKDFKGIIQLPKDANARYITWEQAVENLKFHIGELRQSFFSQLQLPDWSFETMKTTPMSGESRKQLFIDCQLKVLEESGRWVEFFDREINIIKAYLINLLPKEYEDDINALNVETIITPFNLTDERDKIDNLLRANGNKPIISQRESIQYLGWSNDVNNTIKEIHEEESMENAELSL